MSTTKHATCSPFLDRLAELRNRAAYAGLEWLPGLWATRAPLDEGPMVRIRLSPAVSQANFRIAPPARPDLVERQPELLARVDLLCAARPQAIVVYQTSRKF
jgi:hypothetical protein